MLAYELSGPIPAEMHLMQWFSRLMLRLGWIRLADYGLYVMPSGQLASMNCLPASPHLRFDPNWANVPVPNHGFTAQGGWAPETPPPPGDPTAHQAPRAGATARQPSATSSPPALPTGLLGASPQMPPEGVESPAETGAPRSHPPTFFCREPGDTAATEAPPSRESASHEVLVSGPSAGSPLQRERDLLATGQVPAAGSEVAEEIRSRPAGIVPEIETVAADDDRIWAEALARAKDAAARLHESPICGADRPNTTAAPPPTLEPRPADNGEMEGQDIDSDWERAVAWAKARVQARAHTSDASKPMAQESHAPAPGTEGPRTWGEPQRQAFPAPEDEALVVEQGRMGQEPSSADDEGERDNRASEASPAAQVPAISARQVQAMREVQRLQRRASLSRLVPSLHRGENPAGGRRRLAAGTEPPPGRAPEHRGSLPLSPPEPVAPSTGTASPTSPRRPTPASDQPE